MKYAVISDIHGNLEALETVPSDAEAQRVDGYILLGDYCLSNPEPDACVTRIRNLPNAHVIRGNEERYFETLMHQDQRTWTDGQMEISYWCYRNLSPENLFVVASAAAGADGGRRSASYCPFFGGIYWGQRASGVGNMGGLGTVSPWVHLL